MAANEDRFPRIKKGPMLMATRDGNPDEKIDRLLVNSYMHRHIQEKPEYWAKLNEMLYAQGRLKKYAGAVEDIVEKYSFLMLARDQITAYEAITNIDKLFHVKYHTYSFVFMTKAFLDSIAVFINEIYQLGFNGGQIDLKKQSFLESLRTSDAELAQIIDRMRAWLDYVVKYRDNLIHRHSLYIGPLPTIPDSMTDPAEQANYIFEEHHYMPVDPTDVEDNMIETQEGEFIKVTALADEWLNDAFVLFDASLRFFTIKFELADRDTDNC
jgi:hypothetical protein